MIFQGQEFLEDGWFEDTVPLNWELSDDFRGIVRLHRDLIRLRRNLDGVSAGLTGQGIQLLRNDESKNVLAFSRYDQPGQEVMVIAHFSAQEMETFRLGLPGPGIWKIRLNTAASIYSPDYDEPKGGEVEAEPIPWDEQQWSAEFKLAPYSLLILSQ